MKSAHTRHRTESLYEDCYYSENPGQSIFRKKLLSKWDGLRMLYVSVQSDL